MIKFSEHKKDTLYIIVMLILTLAFLNTWLNPNAHSLGDLIEFYYPRLEMLRLSITDYQDLMPLWTPYVFAGEPLFPKSAFLNAFYFPSPFLIFTNSLGALKWTIVLNMFLAGLFMYVLMRYLVKKEEAAFISSLVYMFNGYFLYTTVVLEWVDFSNAYPLIPLVMLFSIKAIRTENFVENSVFAGITLAVMLIASSGTVFLYTTLIIGLYFLTSLLGKNIKSSSLKLAIIGIVMLAVLTGLSAFKLFPIIEYQKEYGVRDRLSWEDASTWKVSIPEFFPQLVEPSLPKFNQQPNLKVGIAAVFLIILALAKYWKNRIVLMLGLLIIVSLLLATGSFLLYLLWKYYPGWGGMRYASRGLILFAFSASCLTGYGAMAAAEWAKKKYNRETLMYLAIATLVILDLAILGIGGKGNLSTQPQDFERILAENRINLYIADQPGIFRIHTYETRGIDWGTEAYQTPLRLENLYGYDSNWYPEYVNRFLAISQGSPAKYWGIMNVKYVTSQQAVNITGLKFVNKFDDCRNCFPEQPAIQKAWGPYLYENEEFMPRAYLINNSILIFGNEEDAKRIMYGIMNEEAFDPRKSVIVLGKEKTGHYSPEELNRYNTIILLQGSVTDASLLQGYKGELLPNIRKGETSFSLLQLKEALRKGEMTAVPDSQIRTIDFDRKTADIPEYSGFLVMSEKYSLFKGWTAKSDGRKKEMLRANGVITALHVDKDRKIEFEYSPLSYRIGAITSAVALIGLILFFSRKKIVSFYKRAPTKETSDGKA